MPSSVVKTEASTIVQELEEAKAQAKGRLHWVLSRSKDKHRSRGHSVFIVGCIFTANDNEFANFQKTASRANHITGGGSDEMTVNNCRSWDRIKQIQLIISPSLSSGM